MKGVLQEKNLLLLWSDTVLYFEWKFNLSDVGPDGIRSSDFGEKEVSYLHIKQEYVHKYVYLYLNNPQRFSNGLCTTIVLNKANSILNTHVWVNDYFEDQHVDLLPSLNLSVDSYPLTVICTVRAPTSDVSQELNAFRHIPNSTLDSLNQLSLDFSKILGEAPYSDVVLNFGGDSIKAHKMVLQARSPVFNKMFSHNSVEVLQNAVEVNDIGTTVMKMLIRYMYSATVEIEKCNFDEQLELYYAADKYEMLLLRKHCKNELLSQINVDNACSLFTLACQHNDESFKKEVELFISNNIKFVVETESFKILSKDDGMQLMYLGIRNFKI